VNRKTAKSLLDFLPFHESGSDIAVVEQSLYRIQKYTYHNIQEGTFRIAASLRERGLEPGDRLILWGENSARWLMTFYACVLQQVVVVPVDASFSAEYVSRIKTITEAKWICADHEQAEWNQLLKTEPLAEKSTACDANPKTLLEIIYTSGATGEPKGVLITHENILSNLIPIHSEIQKYKKYAIPFSPIGFVHLIPVSHLFGQIMGLFIPQMLKGFVVFTDPAPSRILRSVKQNRTSAVICVPQELSLLRKYIDQRFASRVRKNSQAGIAGFIRNYWHHRNVHREFGWKFLAFIVGGATLPVFEEDFWKERAFLVIQGYGLTETAPSVTISHPFHGLKRGSVGKVLPGVEVKIAEDGELLVRGPNVSPGYYRNETATQEAFQDGWLRTGDIGRFDEEGRLQLLGRKKEVIVTAEGLNVFPEDVESIILDDKRVRDCAVVALELNGGSQVHAVFILSEDVYVNQLSEIVSNANKKLEAFQRIRSFSTWQESELPRTSTGKLKRLEIGSVIRGENQVEHKTETLADSILSGKSREGARLEEDIGLSSLDRVELMVDLERRGITVDETSFAEARTISDVTASIRERSSGTGTQYPYWNWAQWSILRFMRFIALYALVLPVLRLRVKVKVSGLENLSQNNTPFLFVSNHQGYLDVPVILKALPFSMRNTLAPAMGTDRTKWEQFAAAVFFNTYPLPGSSVGLRQALEHTGQLVDRGYSPLVFPEGRMTEDGSLQPFRPGVGVIATHIKIPVIPVLLRGVFEIWPTTASSPGSGVAEVSFGSPHDFIANTPAEITAILESWFRERIS
jgi:long-chain acyl-CoA synthetase